MHIDLDKNVKDMLDKFKKKYGCKTYSESVRILLMLVEKNDSNNNSKKQDF